MSSNNDGLSLEQLDANPPDSTRLAPEQAIVNSDSLPVANHQDAPTTCLPTFAQMSEMVALLRDYEMQMMKLREEHHAYKEMVQERLRKQDDKINMNFAFVQKFISEMNSTERTTNRVNAAGQQTTENISQESDNPSTMTVIRKRKRTRNAEYDRAYQDAPSPKRDSYPTNPSISISKLLNPQIQTQPVPSETTITAADPACEDEDDPFAGRTSIPRADEDDFEPEELQKTKPSSSQSRTTSTSSKPGTIITSPHAAAIQAIREKLIAGKAALASRRLSTPCRNISACTASTGSPLARKINDDTSKTSPSTIEPATRSSASDIHDRPIIPLRTLP